MCLGRPLGLLSSRQGLTVGPGLADLIGFVLALRQRGQSSSLRGLRGRGSLVMIESDWVDLDLGGQTDRGSLNFKRFQVTKKASISQLTSKAISLPRDLLC